MSKYKNPINTPKTVTIPCWEYARLIQKSTQLDVIKRMAINEKTYMSVELIKVAIGEDDNG